VVGTPGGWTGLPDGVTLSVAEIVPERYVVLNATRPGRRWNAVRSFHVQPHWEDRVRLLTRARVALRHPGEVFAMELGLLLGIKHRVERPFMTMPTRSRSAVEATGKAVTIETDIPRGPAGPVLVEASTDARMICVGSVGIGRFARSILGSTATELAEKAHCPVAVLRTDPDRPAPDINWIVVRMTDAPDNGVVVKSAVGEAKLRRAPMLVLGGRMEDLTKNADGEFERRVQEWRQLHPEVRVYPITTKDAIASFLSANDERVLLAVISGAEADELAELVGPSGHPLFRHSESSVLVVR
jgi:Universal stress protein family